MAKPCNNIKTIDAEDRPRPRKTHIFKRETHEHYVEPPWCSLRLFDEERFEGNIHDPSCGWGRIVRAARRNGLEASGSDLVDRERGFPTGDFLKCKRRVDNIVCNPPFDIAPQFIRHAFRLSRRKVAFFFPLARVVAAWKWLADLPVRRLWLLTPRPPLPPGHYIASGKKPKSGRPEYCWIVIEHGYRGAPELRWLHGEHHEGKQRTRPPHGPSGH
jgi:hypothetical protein